MPLWGNIDVAANAPSVIALTQLSKTANTATRANVFNNISANIYHIGLTEGLFGVSAREQRVISANTASGAHAGWVLRRVGQGGRAGRVQMETLVAMGSMIGDSENTIFKEARIIVYSQPVSSNEARGNAINFIVGANTMPPGTTITYFWQQDNGNVAQTWANVQNSGVFASANSNTSATLSISNNFTVTGNTFRVTMGVAGGNTVNSANAILKYF